MREPAPCLGTICGVAEAFNLPTTPDVAEMHQRVGGLRASPEGFIWLSPLGSLYRVFLLREDIAAYRSSIGSYHDLALVPYSESKQRAEAVEEQWRAGTRSLLAQLIVPGLSGTLRHATEADARRACLRPYVAVLRHRVRTRSCPETIDALVPECLPSMPIDPFDGKPLRYRPQGAEPPAEFARGGPAEESVVYSIGRDPKDDGGASSNGSKRTGDNAIRW